MSQAVASDRPSTADSPPSVVSPPPNQANNGGIPTNNGTIASEWPPATPPLFVDCCLAVVVGNTRCQWALLQNYAGEFKPKLLWRTGRVEPFDQFKGTRAEWLSQFFPPLVYRDVFHTQAEPTSLDINAVFAARKVSMIPAYIVSTNDSYMNDLMEALHMMPVRITRIGAGDFGTLPYQGVGVDRLASLHGAFSKYGAPALVIDCGTAMTWTMSDEDGSFHGGGIAPGLAMKFKALHTFTDKLPELDHEAVNTRMEECEREEKPLLLFAQNTKDAMITAVLRETALVVAHVIQAFHKKFFKKSHEPFDVVITGGDGPLIHKLLSKQRGHVLQSDIEGLKLPPNANLEVNKNVTHDGIASLLMDKTEAKRNEMSDEELCRWNSIGQRLVIAKDSALVRGSILDVFRGESIKDDKFCVWFEDYSIKELDVAETCAALKLFVEKGETAEVEHKMDSLRESPLSANANFVPLEVKKQRAETAAAWIHALANGESFDAGEMETESLSLKRKADEMERPPIDQTEMLKNPHRYLDVQVAQEFPNGWYRGFVRRIQMDDDVTPFFLIRYTDGDREEYDAEDLVNGMKRYDQVIESGEEFYTADELPLGESDSEA